MKLELDTCDWPLIANDADSERVVFTVNCRERTERVFHYSEADAERNARDIIRAVNAHDDLLAALAALSDWMREHTGPADGTVDMLTRAAAAMDKATGNAPERPAAAMNSHADLIAALRRIRDARDYCAEHGEYPPDVASEAAADMDARAFDDWAADLADAALKGVQS